MIKNSITSKYILWTLLSVVPVMITVGYFTYKTSVSVVVEQTIRNSVTIVSGVIEKIELITNPIEEIAKNLSETYSDDSDILGKQIKAGVNINSNIFGMAIAFEPYKYSTTREKFAPYGYRKDGTIILTSLTNDSYGYMHQKWYTTPKKAKKSLWSEPYFDKGGGNRLMATFSTPIFKNDRFIGVTTADITLEKINTIVTSIPILESGHIFLLSPEGRFISHPNSKIVMKKTLVEYAEELHDSQLDEISRQIQQEKTGFLPYKSNGVDYKVYFSPIKSMGWYVGILFPEKELFAPLLRLTHTTFVISFFGILFLIIAVIIITKRATKRITNLSRIAGIIADGNLTHHIEQDLSSDEIGILSASLNNMRLSLINQIDNLKKITASKQKIESELHIARNIQMNILPKEFPSFPTPHNFDIFATIDPAKEVGGDLYDFFFVDENHFCFLIGDVSGKGVPAALFMAVTKTLIKATATADKSVSETMITVNNELVTNNESCMFVTLFMAFLDVRTGDVEFSCAGHNPPLKLTKTGAEAIKVYPLPPLGAIEDVHYTSHRMQLGAEESLFLYTDGVTEAFDTEEKQYGTERLTNTLVPLYGKQSSHILETVSEDVARFTHNAVQSDDITMLNIRFLKKMG